MERLIYRDLVRWKNDPDRKPLILEGVRQCGKTFILREFGNREFFNFVYFNFEKDDDPGRVFDGNLDPHRIIRDLNRLTSKRIRPNDTLLILDEVQEVPRVLTSLKYFCEEAPEYCVVCAGSLLGILTSNAGSFPVGKVDRLRMYPMTFTEFLMACGEGGLLDYLGTMQHETEERQPFHDTLVKRLREYYVVGGMPAAVSSWVRYRKPGAVTRILRTIVRDYEADFSKHALPEVPKLTAIWASIPSQLAKGNERFLFGEVMKGGRARDLADSLRWLVDAGLVYQVPFTELPATPLKSSVDVSHFKVYLADVGILRVMSGRSESVEMTNDPKLGQYKGSMTENYVLTQIVASGAGTVCCWKRGGDEVDFLIESSDGIVPIEVKAELKTDAHSLGAYVDEYDSRRYYLMSMRPGGSGAALPLYCADKLVPFLRGDGPEEPEGNDRKPYRRDFSVTDWVRRGDVFGMSVPFSDHRVPHPSVVQVFELNEGGYAVVSLPWSVSSEGDVELRSERPVDGFLSILRSPCLGCLLSGHALFDETVDVL